MNRVRDLNKIPPLSSSHANELCMPTCEVCENDYDKAFEVVMGGERHTFDSFECAMHALAPVCPHCNCHIVGSRRRSGRKNLLLCPLRTRVRLNAVEGSRLRVGASLRARRFYLHERRAGTARPTSGLRFHLLVAAFLLGSNFDLMRLDLPAAAKYR